MSREQHPPSANASDMPDDATPHAGETGIEELLREVGVRAEPDAALTDTVRKAVHAEWRAVLQQRVRRRRALSLALAAGVVGLVTATVVLRLRQPGPQPLWVANVVRVEGRPQIEAAGELHEARPGEALQTGMRLQTGDARVALGLGTTPALSVRIDAGSQVHFTAPDAIELHAGALYIDADTAPGSVPLTVRTAAGAVRHIGTQYQVRIVAGAMQGIEVSIREGRVEIASEHGTNAGVAGERLAVSTQGSVVRSALPSYDVSWQWATQVAPRFDISGRPLSEFLEWVARETGRVLLYDSSAAQRAAAELELLGSIGELDPDTALAAVLSTTRLKRLAAPEGELRIWLPRD